MAISVSQLTSAYSGTDASSYVTASISPTAGRLLLVAVSHSTAGDPPGFPVITGCNCTFEIAGAGDATNAWRTATSSNYRTTIYKAEPDAPTPGTLTLSFFDAATGLSAETQTSCAWSITEVSGITDADVPGAVAQAKTATGGATSVSVTLDPFIDPINNAVFMATGVRNGTLAVTPTTGLTELSQVAGSTPILTQQVEWQLQENLTPGATLDTAAAWGAVALELVSNITPLIRPFASVTIR